MGVKLRFFGFREMLLQDRALYSSLWTLSGTRLVCHCRPSEACLGDILVEEFRRSYPQAYDRNDFNAIPPALLEFDLYGKATRGAGE